MPRGINVLNDAAPHPEGCTTHIYIGQPAAVQDKAALLIDRYGGRPVHILHTAAVLPAVRQCQGSTRNHNGLIAVDRVSIQAQLDILCDRPVALEEHIPGQIVAAILLRQRIAALPRLPFYNFMLGMAACILRSGADAVVLMRRLLHQPALQFAAGVLLALYHIACLFRMQEPEIIRTGLIVRGPHDLCTLGVGTGNFDHGPPVKGFDELDVFRSLKLDILVSVLPVAMDLCAPSDFKDAIDNNTVIIADIRISHLHFAIGPDPYLAAVPN